MRKKKITLLFIITPRLSARIEDMFLKISPYFEDVQNKNSREKSKEKIMLVMSFRNTQVPSKMNTFLWNFISNSRGYIVY